MEGTTPTFRIECRCLGFCWEPRTEGYFLAAGEIKIDRLPICSSEPGGWNSSSAKPIGLRSFRETLSDQAGRARGSSRVPVTQRPGLQEAATYYQTDIQDIITDTCEFDESHEYIPLAIRACRHRRRPLDFCFVFGTPYLSAASSVPFAIPSIFTFTFVSVALSLIQQIVPDRCRLPCSGQLWPIAAVAWLALISSFWPCLTLSVLLVRSPYL